MRDDLHRRGVDVRVREGLSLLDRRSFRTTRGRLTLPLRVIRSTAFLCGMIRRSRPDLVHCNTATVFLCGGLAARLCGLPHVWHVREDFGDFPTLWRLYRPLIQALADRIVCVSEFATGQFGDGPIRQKLRVLHNGFPREEFAPVSAARMRAFRRTYSLNGAPLVALIGRVNTFRKGQLGFVEAAHSLSSEFPNARFLLVGSPFPGNESHLEQVRRRIRELRVERSVVYTGDVDDIQAVYQTADIVVQASDMPEGFPGVVVEAMACGKPVVGTQLGGTLEQIVDGETGLLIEPGKPAALADAIGRLLRDVELRQRMGENGRRRFLERFEFERFYARMLDIYRGLLGA